MKEHLDNSLEFHIVITVFALLVLILSIHGTFKKTKKMENKRIKKVVRLGLITVLVCLWSLFTYWQLYPYALSNYEYDNNLTEEYIGVVDSIEKKDKETVYVIIDGTKYKMSHSTAKPVFKIGRDFDEGETVKIVYGRKSMYIFDIYEIKP